MTERSTHSLALALVAAATLTLVECSPPILQNRDSDASAEHTEEEFKVTIGVIILIALFGIGIAFFVGYYVGMTTTRRAPLQVRSTQHVAADTFTSMQSSASATAAAATPPLMHRPMSNVPQLSSADDAALSSYIIIKRGRGGV